MKYAALNINFDSLGEAYGFPGNFRDPSFLSVSKRFLDIADKYGFKYSIYVIGKDLEKVENRVVVSEWAAAGHEIGNHSWSHPINLAAMNRQHIYEEVEKAHRAITDTIGIEPRGFIAPGWNGSRVLDEVLLELGYAYDTSMVPSWIMFPSIFKSLLNHIGDKRFFKILNRRDYLTFLFGKRKPHYKDVTEKTKSESANNVLTLPLPTNRYGIACWHTLAFMFGWKLHQQLLVSCLRDVGAFYYLMHPADLVVQQDLDARRDIHLERLDVPLEQKLSLLEQSIDVILESGRQIVTMRELAAHHAAKLLDDSQTE
jgi:Polysaccharide deacetylase